MKKTFDHRRLALLQFIPSGAGQWVALDKWLKESLRNNCLVRNEHTSCDIITQRQRGLEEREGQRSGEEGETHTFLPISERGSTFRSRECRGPNIIAVLCILSCPGIKGRVLPTKGAKSG